MSTAPASLSRQSTGRKKKKHKKKKKTSRSPAKPKDGSDGADENKASLISEPSHSAPSIGPNEPVASDQVQAKKGSHAHITHPFGFHIFSLYTQTKC
jgi:hypothetical protein